MNIYYNVVSYLLRYISRNSVTWNGAVYHFNIQTIKWNVVRVI